MHQLQRAGEDILENAAGIWGLIIWHMDEGLVASINPDTGFETASVAKASIDLDIVEQIVESELRWDEQLTLKAHHLPPRDLQRLFLRPGTGLLKDLTPGLRITIGDLFELLNVESDNVAANMILERLGGQSEVNKRLRARGIENTGLTDRSDRFESGVATPAQMLLVLEELIRTAGAPSLSAVTIGTLRRSHFTGGLRQFENLPDVDYRRLRLKLIASGLMRTRGKQLELMRQIMDRPVSKIASKEGVLPDYQGVSYLHELAIFESRLLVAAFSKGTPDNGYSIETAKTVLGQLGQTIHDYYSR